MTMRKLVEHVKTKFNPSHDVYDNYCDKTKSITIVELNKTGRTIVAIGMNPHGNEESLTVKDYNKRIREEKDRIKALEPTRRTPIYCFEKEFGYENLKRLIQLDLFVKRTLTSNELIEALEQADEKVCKRLIGKNNLSTIKENIEKADYIFLAWGSGIPWDCTVLDEYRKALYEILLNKKDICYFLGATKNGSPKHPCFHGKTKLLKMSETDIKKAFNLHD